MGTTCVQGNYGRLRDFMEDFHIEWFDREWGSNFNLLDYSIVGNDLYLLIHSIPKDEKFITLVKCSKKGRSYCYKYIEDNMNPYYYDCPERLLKKATSSSPSAQQWYKDCRLHREIKKERKGLVELLMQTKRGIGAVIKDCLGRDVEYQYVMNKNFLIGKCMEDGKVYRWKFDLFPIETLRNLVSEKKTA